MKKRIFIFDGTDGAADMMEIILNHYIEVAFPIGGSDCAAASREALQSIVDKIKQADEVEISRRQRPMLKGAVKWYHSQYLQSEYAALDDVMYNRLLSQFEKTQNKTR